MKFNKIVFHLAWAMLASSLATTGAYAGAAQDVHFESIARQFIERYLAGHPETATQLGDHRFDAETSDYSLRGVAAERALYRGTLTRLEALPANSLSPDNAVDDSILKNELRRGLLDIDVLHVAERNPLNYNPANGIYTLLAREYAPLADRLAAVRSRLQAMPAIVAAARRNLKNPPRIFTETAIQQNQGAISLVRDDLEDFVKQAPAMRDKLAAPRKKAIAALESYGRWLKKDLLPRSHGEFRIGKEAFAQKLRLTLDSDLPPERILAQAEAELKATQAAMLEVALPLYRGSFPAQAGAGGEPRVAPKVVIRAVLDKLAETRPDNATIVDQAKTTLAAATDFVRASNLVSLPADPVKVIVMPEFNRGVAIAYCDAAGPLDKNGATFYAIAPTPADWKPARVTSFFREYNSAMLNDLTVHEAMPGHYLQLAAANKVKATTPIRALFSSGSFVEGWATYAEQVMAGAGFGGPETHMQQMKMRLRLVINAIIDQKIHAGTMTEEEAMKLMMTEGFQEEGEAAGKWRRALLTSTQLSTYFVGNVEINALARDMQTKTGGDMKAVHDRMLSYGSIATKYVRQLAGLPAQSSAP